jgi:hypothetical protein
MTDSDAIWNRAAMEELPADAPPGERALHDALEQAFLRRLREHPDDFAS